MSETANCKRCGEAFQPEWIELFQQFSDCCDVCQCRNVFDGLDMPMPPELLDRHTKNPTLSELEFMEKLKGL